MSHDPRALRRELDLTDAVGIGFGAIVGAGIFVVTGVAAGIAGPSFILALGIAGLAAAANALSSAQLAAAYPAAGGTYEYGYRVLHPWAGFIAGWMFLVSKIAAAGTVAIGLAGYLDHLVPALPARAAAVGAIVLFTALNYFGIRRSSRVNIAIVSISVGTLLLFVAFTLPQLEMRHFRPFTPGGWTGTLQAAAILFFAYTGYARIATLGGEVRDPRTTIPRAITITIAGAIVLYIAVAVAATGAIGTSAMSATTTPLLEASRQARWAGLPFVVAAGGVCAMLGVILSQVLGLSRMVFAMASRDDLPRTFAHVDPVTGSPRRAVLLVGAAAALVAAAGTLHAAAAAAAFAILIYYGIANSAALRMPRASRLYPAFVPALGLFSCAVLALSLPRATILAGTAFGLVGALFRVLRRRGLPQA